MSCRQANLRKIEEGRHTSLGARRNNVGIVCEFDWPAPLLWLDCYDARARGLVSGPYFIM
jgi:hypothetical protein